ncbi:MarR family winged helix-turn-helix transcriptional regulator [Candidatus Uabimicrobium amorphum]|uniref:MarR family transcriptional regulator n=1 Tax=Uabimicrobium amorphum TaxID=2596890 RepID=A0A5S9IP65_UABAM|nr:MarR family transcriptional regulator [Candidatus Uabimicrobium amorphum]BBM85334.1 MarR family transcriptional regulator [Candidatus Uabimicrobium amorphum]
MSDKNIDAKIDDYFDGCLYFSLSRLQRHINKLAKDIFSEINLVPSHAFLLMALNENEMCTASYLSELLGLAPSTITRFIDKLEKEGFCVRELKGRVSYTSITPEGRDLIPRIHKCWKQLFHRYNEVYGEKNAKLLNDMIVKLNKLEK